MLGQILPVVGQAWAQSGVVCLVSPYNMYTFSIRQVMRIQINNHQQMTKLTQ